MTSIDVRKGIGHLDSDAVREGIESAMAQVLDDLLQGCISESTAFDMLCQRLATLTGIPTERTVSH